MEIIKIPLEQFTPDPHNAKDHPQWQIEQIKKSIQQFGNLDPIGVWGDDNLIVVGHGRYEALKELGYQEAECIRLDWLTEEERRAYALVHNKTTMNSGFIPDALDMNLDAIGEIDMSLFGFDLPKSNNEQLAEVTKDDEDYSSIHYLVSIGVDEHDKIAPLMQKCEDLGAAVHMTRNDL